MYEKSEQIAYNDYAAYSTKRQKAYANKTLEEIEDIFWRSGISKSRKYAIDNEITLFGDDVEMWNLSKLTNEHSNIHTTTYYRNVSKPRIFWTCGSGVASC